MQGVEASNKTLKGTEYRIFNWYLLWEDIPAPVLAAVPDGTFAHIMQLWVAMALDYLRDQGFEFQVSPLVDKSPLKALQRNTESFADMCKPANCSLEDFEEYFEIQPYFTTYFDHVEISMILRLKEGKTSAEYMVVLPCLRDEWSVVVGVDPGLPPPQPSHALTQDSFTLHPPRIDRNTCLCAAALTSFAPTFFDSLAMLKAKNCPVWRWPRPRTVLLQKNFSSDIWYKASFGVPPITLKDGTFADQFVAMSIGTFWRYFNRGALPRPGKEFWSDIFLAFNGDSRNFNRDSYQDLSNDFGVSLYAKGIQTSEYAERPYWFLYSHPDIDYDYLKIPDGTPKPKYNPNVPTVSAATTTDESVLQAAQLSCGSEHLQHISLILPTLFNRERSDHRLASHLRLVTAHGTAVTERERVYQTSARLRQLAYMSFAKTFVINTIVDLNTMFMGDSGPISLRQFILGITRPSDPDDSEPLFVEVGPKLQAPGKVVLVVRPEAYLEAEPYVAGLFPMIVHFHGHRLAAAFHPTTRIVMAQMEWDPIRRVVISPHDHTYDDMNKDDDWLAFENLNDVVLPVTEKAQAAAAGRAMIGEDDANTIGSLRAAQANIAPPAKKGQQKRTDRTDSTIAEIERYKASLKGLFLSAGMDFDSDDESISTSLTVREQMLGLKELMQQVQHVVATQKDLAEQKKASKDSNSADVSQPSGELSGSSSSQTDPTGKHTLLAPVHGATQKEPC
eukprot:scaffold81137_cov52-Attheya_sp.AAC.5